jgi:hypothetical protein
MKEIEFSESVKRLKYFTKKGPNSWYVQSQKDRYLESFYVSIVPPGGIIVMTGDYDGVMVNPYCSDAKEAIRWMAGATTLSYFAEKVGLANQYHRKTEYNSEKAAEELADRICGYFDMELISDYVKTIFNKYEYDGQDLEKKLLAIEDFDVGANIKKIKDALDCVIDNGLEMIDNFHEVCSDLERLGIHDTWELNPDIYTDQLKWQHQLLLWWANNVIDKQDVEYFEV